MAYLFSSEYFAMDETGIHLLRSGYNYKSILYPDIRSIDIKDGKEHDNWLPILVMGALLTAFGIYEFVGLIGIFKEITNTHEKVSIYRVILPLLPFMLGVYSLITSLKNSKVMIVYTQANKKYYFSLREFTKENKYLNFTSEVQKLFPNTTIR